MNAKWCKLLRQEILLPFSVKSKMFKEENNEEMFLIGDQEIPLYIDKAIVQRAC